MPVFLVTRIATAHFGAEETFSRQRTLPPGHHSLVAERSPATSVRELYLSLDETAAEQLSFSVGDKPRIFGQDGTFLASWWRWEEPHVLAG